MVIKIQPFGAGKLTRNANPNKYRYTAGGIRLNVRTTFSLSEGEFGKSIDISVVDNSSSAFLNNKKKDIIVLLDIQQMD